jgi:hypothetical protein
MSGRFTAGFESLHQPGLKDRRVQRPSDMWGPDAERTSTLSLGTRRLVEKLARQSNLNRDQMRALGSLASAGRNSLHTAPGRMGAPLAPSMTSTLPAHARPYQDRAQKVHTMAFG